MAKNTYGGKKMREINISDKKSKLKKKIQPEVSVPTYM